MFVYKIPKIFNTKRYNCFVKGIFKGKKKEP